VDYQSLHQQHLTTLSFVGGDFRVARHHPDDKKLVKHLAVTNGGRTIMPASEEEVIPWKYSTVNNRDDNAEYNHREILPYEVVWESDSNNTINNIALGVRLYELLIKDGLVASCWLSGNKSLHVHCLFEHNDNIDSKLFKEIIFYHYARNEVFDKQLLGKHLIRGEYCLHEKTMNRKEYFCGSETPFINKIPSWVQHQADVITLKEILSEARRTISNGPYKVPSCIGVLFSKEYYSLTDGRKRALFLLSATLAGTMSYEQILDKLIKWNDGHNTPLTTFLLRQAARNATNSHERGIHMGCKYRHSVITELGLPVQCGNYKNPDNRSTIVGEPLCQNNN
jgi:hypothetical protein